MSTSPSPDQAMQFMFDVQVYGHLDFTGQWYGWKLRGRHLVAPDGQRISQERLDGLLWRDAMELRLAGYSNRRQAEKPKQSVRVVVVDLQDYREHGIAAA